MSHAVAVLGLGSIGLRHARNLIALGCNVTGFDPDPQRRELLDAAGGTSLADSAAALDGCAAAVVASPSHQHRSDLARAIDAGLHVFIEKPLSHTASGMGELLAQAAAKERIVFAGLMLRWHPCVELAREILADGRLGELLWARATYGSWLPDWRPHTDYRMGYAADPETGGVLFDLIHEFDLMQHLLGYAEVAGAAVRRSGLLDMPSEDIAEVVLRHPNGLLTSLHVDYLTRPAVRTVEIAGAEGQISLNLNTRHFAHRDREGALANERMMPGSYADDYIAEMRDFVACIDGRQAPRCDGTEALQVLTTVIAARRMCGLPENGE